MSVDANFLGIWTGCRATAMLESKLFRSIASMDLVIRSMMIGLLLCATVSAQSSRTDRGASSVVLDPQYRDRYQKVLRRNPFQDRAFEALFTSYFSSDGLDAWVALLDEPDERPAIHAADLILAGRIYTRLFQADKAIEYLEQVQGESAANPKLNVLLGKLYDGTDRKDESIARLNDALGALTDPDDRADAARILGGVLIRAGRIDEAAETWNRIAAESDDLYALLALAEIYESHQKWPEAIEVHRRIIDADQENTYRQCREMRAIGDIQLRRKNFSDAVAAYEDALDFVAPGNWLFADLKQRLISAYEAWENLPAFADYLTARIDADASDIEFRVLLAETQRRLEQFDKAEATLLNALERAPGHLRANEALIELYMSTDRTEDLQRTLASLAKLFPDDTEYLRRLGEAHFRSGDSDHAIATWRALVENDNVASRHAQLAAWFEQYGLVDEAVSAFESALALEDSREWRLRLADLHYQNDAPEDAVRVWTSTLTAAGSTAEDYVEIAMILAARELLDDAETLLLQALELDPNNGQTALNLAKLLARRGKFEEALPHFAGLADQNEQPYLRERGVDGLLDAYASLGILQSKKNEWELRLEKNPESLPLLARLAELEVRLGNKRHVVRLYEQCTDLAPDDPNYRLALARAYRTNEQPLRAITAYKQLIELDASRAAGYYRELAALCVEERQTEEAVNVARAIVASAPADFPALRGLARAYSANGQRDEALDAFRKLLQLKPGDPDALREYGDMLAGYSRFGEAQEAYRNLLAAAPNDRVRLEAVRLLAALYEDHGHADDLIREFRALAEQAPDNPSVQEELAAVYTASGDGDRAVEVLESALRLSADEETGLRKLLRAAYEAGDLEKVVAVHHQLEAVRGDLTPRERERLGVAYARLGAYRDAIAAWDVLYLERPGNPDVLESLAQTMRDEGFHHRALAVMDRAVTLAPYEFTMRYQYAIRLAIAERSSRAILQLKTILELGDKAEEAPEGVVQFAANTNRSVMGQQRQGLSKKPPLALLEALGKSWQGSFNEFRRVVIYALLHIAREAGTAEGHLEDFRQAVMNEPKSGRAKEDLLIAYQAAERWGAALDVAQTLAQSQPDNLWLLREIALMTQRSKRIETSIERQVHHMELYPESWTAASLSVLPLLYQQGKKEKASTTVNAILDRHGEDARIMQPLASVLRGFGAIDDVIPLYERLIEIDPPDGDGTRFKLARLYAQQGRAKDARAIYEQLLFEERRNSIRTSQIDTRGSRFIPNGFHGIGEVIDRFRWDVDVQRMTAFDALVNMDLGGTEPASAIERIRSMAESLDPAADSRRKTLDLSKILIAYHIQQEEYDAAQSLLETLQRAGANDAELHEFRFFEDVQQ